MRAEPRARFRPAVPRDAVGERVVRWHRLDVDAAARDQRVSARLRRSQSRPAAAAPICPVT